MALNDLDLLMQKERPDVALSLLSVYREHLPKNRFLRALWSREFDKYELRIREESAAGWSAGASGTAKN
ncbi:MAG: hypothetical protein G8D28_02735 [gamma proteobacterium symbiont of Phacoides pectinatus]